MTNEERLTASIDQIKTFYNSQFIGWHLAAVKSIRKILLNLDDFYNDLLEELEFENEKHDIVHCQIRNGWFYEAVTHAELVIEDLFATLMNLKDLSTFTKDELFYKASEAKKYIWNFNADDLEYLTDQFDYKYFPLDEPWEVEEAFKGYRDGVLLTQEYVKELQAFHKKYYDDYCQYKHGLSVGLAPMENPLMKSDSERRNAIMANPLEGALFTFHNGTVGDYQKRTGELPAMLLQLKTGMQPHLTELHNDRNLLFSTMHHVDIEEVVRTTEHACILMNVVWTNIIKRCDGSNEIAYPLPTIKKYCVIGYPKDE